MLSRTEKTTEFIKWRMSNVDRNKLRRIDVDVKSYGSNAKWFLETDNFETELIDGQTNVIDFKMDLIKKSRLSSLLDAAKNRLSSLVDAAKNCFCSKDEEQKNKKKVLGFHLCRPVRNNPVRTRNGRFAVGLKTSFYGLTLTF